MKNLRLFSSFLMMSTLGVAGCASVDNQHSDTLHEPVAAADKSTIQSWVKNQILLPESLSASEGFPRYLVGQADLNNDGSFEYLVLMQERYFCGSGGCSAFIFNQAGQVVHHMTVVKTPVLLADSYRNGWQDFVVWSNGAYRLMSHNGDSYPSNPSLEPKVDKSDEAQAAMNKVVDTELYQQDGYDINFAEPQELWGPSYQYHFTFKHYGDPQNLYHALVDMKNNTLDVEAKPIQ